jgi:hypothetical protein
MPTKVIIGDAAARQDERTAKTERQKVAAAIDQTQATKAAWDEVAAALDAIAKDLAKPAFDLLTNNQKFEALRDGLVKTARQAEKAARQGEKDAGNILMLLRIERGSHGKD